MKIYLIGYMGSGKSTIGRLLADQLKLAFIDFDKYIENETGKSISQIFDTDGEVKFREMEHEYLKKLLGKDNVVVSLGGGTPCFHNNIDIINTNGISIYLEVDADTLTQRLSKEKSKRPLIKDLSEAELKNFIETSLEKRRMIYEKANLAINTTLLSVGELTKEIIKRVMNKESEA